MAVLTNTDGIFTLSVAGSGACLTGSIVIGQQGGYSNMLVTQTHLQDAQTQLQVTLDQQSRKIDELTLAVSYLMQQLTRPATLPSIATDAIEDIDPIQAYDRAMKGL